MGIRLIVVFGSAAPTHCLSAAAKKTYIVCAENNTKENETTYYYLQYNGNEAAIARFAKVTHAVMGETDE